MSIALEARGLVKIFGDKRAVDGVDLTIPKGTFYGIAGPNGAGKSTTLRMLTGLLRPDAGTVTLDGVSVWPDPLQAKARDMAAENLANDFKGQLAFLGGIDAQDLMTNGSPCQIRADVLRVRKLLGPHLIVSPSHETILPNVPLENVQALAEAALDPEVET